MSFSYSVPNVCCICLGPPSATIGITHSRGLSSGIETTTYPFPICLKCLDVCKRAKIKAFWHAVPGVIIPAVIGAFVVGLHSQQWLLGAFMGAVILGSWIAPALYAWYHRKLAPPIAEYSENYGLRFRNKEYQALFEKANVMVFGR
jgi:hypothetical protein